jgi:glyoxylase-like metal-dependent hydrolase (beta-lactamase superfamily II)
MPKLPTSNVALAALLAVAFAVPAHEALAAESVASLAPPGHAGKPFPQAPDIAPIGVHIDKYMDLPDVAKGPPIDSTKGYRLEELGRGLYMVTDNGYQSMFLVYEAGVVVVDAPPSYAAKLKQAIAEVTRLPITHLVYSHSHADHIGGAGTLGGKPVIVAQEETLKFLKRDADPARPLPTLTFKDRYVLRVGTQRLELSYHGNGHEPGNIFIHAPEQKTLMVVDIIFPGWMPFRRLAVSQDLPAWLAQVKYIDTLPFDKLVGGHVTRIGTHADVRTQIEYLDDLKAAVGAALKETPFVADINPADSGNAWALTGDYTARVAVKCVNALTPKWSHRLGGFDAFAWDQCYAMEQSLRVD